ncbi:MAG: universal stress protein [Pseudomonadota bacterium]
MSTEDTRRAVRHILLALDSAQDASALELAAQLAALLQGTLQGVFVENSDLLRLAQLPFAHEIALNSAAIRRLETAQLERDLRAQAEQVRRLLESQAQQYRVEWTFRIERGALTTTLAASGGTDVVMLGRSNVAPREQRATTPVLIAFDGSPAARRALDTAADLAGKDLLVLLPAEGAAELRSAASAQLTARGLRASYLILPELSPHHLIAAGRRHHCRMLVMSGNPAELLPRMQHASCPVAVVQ